MENWVDLQPTSTELIVSNYNMVLPGAGKQALTW
jgi:hypothetical protein